MFCNVLTIFAMHIRIGYWPDNLTLSSFVRARTPGSLLRAYTDALGFTIVELQYYFIHKDAPSQSTSQDSTLYFDHNYTLQWTGNVQAHSLNPYKTALVP